MSQFSLDKNLQLVLSTVCLFTESFIKCGQKFAKCVSTSGYFFVIKWRMNFKRAHKIFKLIDWIKSNEMPNFWQNFWSLSVWRRSIVEFGISSNILTLPVQGIKVFVADWLTNRPKISNPILWGRGFDSHQRLLSQSLEICSKMFKIQVFEPKLLKTTIKTCRPWRI